MMRKLFLPLAVLAIFYGFYWLTGHLTKPRLPQSEEAPLLYANQVEKDLAQSLTQAIAGAKKSVVLLVYTLTDQRIIQALNKKAAEGVDVEVVVDGRASPYADRKLSKDIKLLKRFSDGLMHLKVLVIDESQVFIGSANMTSDSLHMHGNLVTALVNPALAQYILQKARSMPVDGLGKAFRKETFTFGNQQLEIWFLPDNPDAIHRLKQLMREAKKSIQIAMFTWTRRDLAQEVVDAKKRGVNVQVVLDHYAGKGAGAAILKILTQNDIDVRMSQGGALLHHKCMVVDGETLVNGSANWTKAAFTQNDDCFIVLHNLTEEQRKTLENLWQVLRNESRPAR